MLLSSLVVFANNKMNLSKLFNPAKWSLSRKFISIVFLILLIPLASIGLLKEIEKTLVNNLKANLSLSSRLIGSQLASNLSWFEESLLPDSKTFLGKELFVFPLNQSFELDGYTEDWRNYEIHRRVFSHEDNSFAILLGSFKRHLMISIQVNDEFMVYPQVNNDFVSDQIEIEFKNHSGEYQRIFLAPQTGGRFPVRTFRNGKLKIDWRYKANWIATSAGGNLELQFPSGFKPKELKVTYKNVDQQGLGKYQKLYSSSSYDLNPLVWPSTGLVNYFDRIQLSPAQRIWVLDTHGRVLASAGDLKASEISFSRNPVFNWFLASQSDIQTDPRENNLRLDSEEIYLALKGQTSTRIENIPNSDQSIALAGFPIKNGDKVYGVLLLEENIARVQILQRKTLINMFGIIFAVFLLVMWIIFWYVSKMVGRIKYLNTAIDQTVDQQGRMKVPLALKHEKGDEIDELYRAFGHMGTKLFEYNDHLEKLASRLSHELRTPIAIVRSSLDNLLLSCKDEEDREIIHRALQGNQRLGEIISRMRQASGVKEAMQSAEKELIDIEEFLQQVIKGYQISFAKFDFKFNSTITRKKHSISPDLFSEMLDKLISNAMEFCSDEKPIVISLIQDKKATVLSVSNSGPVIPKKNLRRIFHSLVSIRTNQQATGTNLGLGLYVVRLIAEFHKATVRAENRVDESGVVFSVRW